MVLILCGCWSRRRLTRSPKEVRHIDHDRHRGERGWIIAHLPGTIVNDGARTIPIVAPRTVLRSRTRLAGKVWQWQCCRTQSLADAVLVPITRSSVNHLCSYRFYPGYWIFRRVSDPPKYLLTKYRGVESNGRWPCSLQCA